MKWIKRLFYFLAFLYITACVLLYVKQEELIFHGRQRSADHVYGEGAEINLTAEDGTTINTVLQDVPDERGVVLYFHGNRGDNGRALYQARGITDAGYDLMVYDYRGYGKSGGTMESEAQWLADAELAYDYLAERYAEDKIILTGYSLGTGPATYLAKKRNPAKLVLAAPYLSLSAMKNLFLWMVPDFLLKYDMDTKSRLAETRCPVVIVHGRNDELIPYAMGEELRDVDPERIELVELPGVGHRGVVLSSAFRNAVTR